MFMHSGLYDDSPRSREIVWIMIAQRAARGLGSLYAHANQMTMAEAGQVHVKWTPRHWMNREPHLLQFEQHLYLRQPGYGTSYITGKYIIELCKGTAKGHGGSKWGIRHFEHKEQGINLIKDNNNAFGGVYGPFFTVENGLINPPAHMTMNINVITEGPLACVYQMELFQMD